MKKTEKILLEIFSSKKTKLQKWFNKALISRGVEKQFAKILAKFEKINKELLECNPELINRTLRLLIKEYKEYGFDEKIALVNPGRLRRLKQLGLPVTSMTIRRNPEILLKNKERLKQLGLPVTLIALCRNPETLLKNKERLEQLGIPVTLTTIYRNPETLFKNKERLEQLGIPVTLTTIYRNPETLLSSSEPSQGEAE